LVVKGSSRISNGGREIEVSFTSNPGAAISSSWSPIGDAVPAFCNLRQNAQPTSPSAPSKNINAIRTVGQPVRLANTGWSEPLTISALTDDWGIGAEPSESCEVETANWDEPDLANTGVAENVDKAGSFDGLAQIIFSLP
jgi:hypothetical protein